MDYEQHKEEYRERIKSLRLIDDVFMSKVFDGNVEGATLLVRTVLGKPDLDVTDVRTQEELKNLQGRSVRLGMLARDGAGRLYNIEVQRKDEGAGIKRASLHSALLVSRACEPGCEPVDYPEVYVIFITENDVLKKGRPLYRIEQMIVDDGEEVDDGEHVVYVNGECRNEDTDLGRLMHDFFCRDPRDMHPKLSTFILGTERSCRHNDAIVSNSPILKDFLVFSLTRLFSLRCLPRIIYPR